MKRKQIIGKTISIREAFAQFQRLNQTKNLSPGTIRYHDNHSEPLFAFLEDISQPVESIAKEKIDAYILYLKSNGNSISVYFRKYPGHSDETDRDSHIVLFT